MRSLGEFFGHVWSGVKSKPLPPREVVRREVQERTIDTPSGKVTLRRTTIDEIGPARDDARTPDRAQENGPG